MQSTLLELLAVLALIGVNGFFSMAEMALVASRKTRLTALAAAGNRRAELCLELLKRPETFLSAVQIGITLAGVLASAFGGATLAAGLADRLKAQPGLAPYAHTLALAAVVVPITLFTLVLGELVPKRLAMARAEPLAMAAAPVMRTLMLASVPAVWFLGVSTTVVLRLFGLHKSHEPTVTEEDIRGLLHEGAHHGVLEQTERDIMERLLRLGDRPLGVIMTHRSQVEWLDIEAPAEENLAKVLASRHTRFPVCRGDSSDILGVVRAKDLLAACARGQDLNIAAHLSQPQYLPETMRGLKLLEHFKRTPHLPFAVVVDEYGDVQGIVTLTDVFEDIVGDLPVPGAPLEQTIVRRDDGSLLVDAATPMDEVAAAMGLPRPWPENLAGSTLAGFVLAHLDHVPRTGEVFSALGVTFEVVDMDGRRIDQVLVTPGSAESEEKE